MKPFSIYAASLLVFITPAIISGVPVHTVAEDKASERPASVSTKVTCSTVQIDRTHPISITTPKPASPKAGEGKGCNMGKEEPYKVLMTVNGEINWESFTEFQVANQFRDSLRKKGSYRVCTFTPPASSGQCPWTEVILSEGMSDSR